MTMAALWCLSYDGSVHVLCMSIEDASCSYGVVYYVGSWYTYVTFGYYDRNQGARVG